MVLGGNTPFIRAVAPYIAQPLHIGSTVKNVLITSGIHSQSAFYPGNWMLVKLNEPGHGESSGAGDSAGHGEERRGGRKGEVNEKTERWQLKWVTVVSSSPEIQLYGEKHIFGKYKIQEKEIGTEVGWGRLVRLEMETGFFCLYYQDCKFLKKKPYLRWLQKNSKVKNKSYPCQPLAFGGDITLCCRFR